MKTMQEEMKTLLQKAGLPYHEIAVYGSQITIECISRDSCAKWVPIISKLATVRGMIKSLAYAKDQTKRTTIGPKVFDVWRLYAKI